MSRRSHHPRGVRTALAILAVLTSLVLAACSATSPAGSEVSGGPTAVVSPGVPAPSDSVKMDAGYGTTPEGLTSDASRVSASSPSLISAPSLIVVNKTMRIETAKVDEAIAKIRTLVARDGAEISSMQVSNSSDEPVYREPVPLADGSIQQSSASPLRAFVTIRVPSDKYAAFIADAAKLGRVLTESENSDDVTQQHVDMKARLGNLDAEQTRLRQLFAKATTVKDMLAVEQELTRVQGEIESMQAQIDYLERQAARATVTLELTEPAAIVRPTGTDWGVRTALTDAIRAFVATMNALIVLLGPVLALLVFVGLPAGLIAWLIVRIVRRRRARHAASAGPDAATPQQPTAEEFDDVDEAPLP